MIQKRGFSNVNQWKPVAHRLVVLICYLLRKEIILVKFQIYLCFVVLV